MAHLLRSKCTINTLECQLRKQEEYLLKQMMIMNEKVGTHAETPPPPQTP